MTLAGELDSLLQPGKVRAVVDGRAVEAEVEDADRLGVSLRRLRVEGGSSERIAERASRALGETIVPIEVDPALGGGVFRTAPDAMTGREFYELRNGPTETTVERHRVGEHGREAVPYTLTRKQLHRLVDSLAEE